MYPYFLSSLSTIPAYRGSSISSPWSRLDHRDVAKQLDRILERPDLLDQGEFGCCGEVAFLRSWMLRDPDAVAFFASQLFHSGQAEISHSGYVVHASPDLMTNDYAQTNPAMPLTSAGWMLCGALADEEDDWVGKFSGTPDQSSSLGTMATEVATWLQATGQYSSVDHNLCAFNETTGAVLTAVVDIVTGLPIPNFSDSQTIADALNLDPGPQPDGTQADIVLAINANMFLGLLASSPGIPSPLPASGLSSLYANHWIMLEDKIQVIGPDRYRLKIWTWGQVYEIDVSSSLFNDNYYGAIRAHGFGLRANGLGQHATQTVMPEPAERWDVWYNAAGTELHASWIAAHGTARWCTVVDAGLDSPVLDAWGGVGDARERGYQSSTIGYYDKYSLANVIVAGAPGDAISPFVPDWDDRFAHAYAVRPSNFYVEPHVTTPNIVASAPMRPMDRTETGLFRISFYGHARTPVADQIAAAHSFDAVTVRLASGRTLGSMSASSVVGVSGRALFEGKAYAMDGSALPVWLDAPRAPNYIARIAVAMHACQHWLDRAPLNLLPPTADVNPPSDAFASGLLPRVFVCRNIPSDANPGSAPIRLDPDLADDDAIALAALDALIDQAGRRAGVAAGDPQLDTPVRLLLRDTVLGSNVFQPLLEAFSKDASAGAGTLAGAAAYWAYLGAQNATAADPRGLAAIGTVWSRCYFAAPHADEYRRFAVALAATTLATAPTEVRYSFGPYRSAMGRTSASSANVQVAAAANFSGTLNALACHVLTIDSAVPNVRVKLNAGAAVFLQMVLVDANDAIIDVIDTELGTCDRVVGLRGGTVRKILLVLSSNNAPTTQGGPYTIHANAEMLAADVDVQKVWLTCVDANVADAGGARTDVIDVINFAAAIAHVQFRNWGNAPADMAVKLYATQLHPTARPRQPVSLTGSNPVAMSVTVPAPAAGSTSATIESTANFDPGQLGLGSQPAGKRIPIEYLLLEAVAENAPGSTRVDGSTDDNTATATVHTNAAGLDTGGPVHVGPIAVVGVDDPRLWRVSAMFDGVDVIHHGREIGDLVTATVIPAGSSKMRVPAIAFDVNVQGLAKARVSPPKVIRRLAGTAVIAQVADPYLPWRKVPAPAQPGTLTLAVTSRGAVVAKTAIRIPATVHRLAAPTDEGAFRKLIVELGTSRAKELIADVEQRAGTEVS